MVRCRTSHLAGTLQTLSVSRSVKSRARPSFSRPMKAVLDASYCWGHRQRSAAKSAAKPMARSAEAGFLYQVPRGAGGIAREAMPNGLADQLFTIFYI